MLLPAEGVDLKACSPSGQKRALPGVRAAEDLAHQLHAHQVAQQGVDADHLEEQEGPGHEHHGVAAGEVIQEVLWREDS